MLDWHSSVLHENVGEEDLEVKHQAGNKVMHLSDIHCASLDASAHHMAQDHPTGSETSPSYAPEAADLAQNHPLWRIMSTYGATQS